MKVLLIPLFSAFALASTVYFRNDDPKYFADYNVDTTDQANPELVMQLTLLNYNLTNITGSDGS